MIMLLDVIACCLVVMLELAGVIIGMIATVYIVYELTGFNIYKWYVKKAFKE